MPFLVPGTPASFPPVGDLHFGGDGCRYARDHGRHFLVGCANVADREPLEKNAFLHRVMLEDLPPITSTPHLVGSATA